MAERRMFSKTVIDSDAFLDMPLSTQALYFHLSMRADDDGFVGKEFLMRWLGCIPTKKFITSNFKVKYNCVEEDENPEVAIFLRKATNSLSRLVTSKVLKQIKIKPKIKPITVPAKLNQIVVQTPIKIDL